MRRKNIKYDIPKILELWKAGKTQKEIGELFGVSQCAVGIVMQRSEGWVANNRRAWTPERRREAVDLYRSGKTQMEISKALHTNTWHVRRVLLEEGVPLRTRSFLASGSKNPSWKGGRTVSGGYVYLFMPNHSSATKNGYILEHRLVMEALLGRKLGRSEVVHHINGDTMDNRPENLSLFESNKAHLATTLRGKCPNWTEEGKARIAAAPRHRGR